MTSFSELLKLTLIKATQMNRQNGNLHKYAMTMAKGFKRMKFDDTYKIAETETIHWFETCWWIFKKHEELLEETVSLPRDHFTRLP